MDDTITFLGMFAERTTFQTFDDSKQNRPALAKIRTGTLAKHQDELKALNDQGAGVFFMVNEGDGNGRKANNVQRVTASFIDMDGTPLSSLDESPLKPHIIVESSPSKFHAYWIIKGAPLDTFSSIQKQLAAKFDSDPSVNDLPRVMRVPGFNHVKDPDNPFETEILALNTQPPFEYEDFITTMGVKATPDQTPTQKKPLPTGMIPGHQRNTTLFHRACELRAKGLADADVHQIISTQGALNGKDQAEIDKIVKSACSYEDNRIYPLTELGNADRFVDRYSHIIRYVDVKDRFIEWNDNYWQVLTANTVTDRMTTLMRSIKNEVALTNNENIIRSIRAWAKKCQQVSTMNNSLRYLKSIGNMRVQPIEIDSNSKLFAGNNYTINLETGEYYKPRQEDLITQHSQIAIDPAAKCPVWEKTLLEIMDNDELTSFMKRMIGYTLYGGNEAQCILFLHGYGSNGKSTFLKTMQHVFGQYATTVDQSLFMSGGRLDSNAPRPDKLRLKGIKYVLCTEVDENKKLDEGFVKVITGNDTIEARGLYQQDSDQFEPMLTPWVAMNNKPIIHGDGHAIWRRIILIPFERTFEDTDLDPRLSAKLKAELPGILNWCVEGCLEYLENGLQIPDQVKAATAAYRNEMDLLIDWLDDTFDMGKGKDDYVLYPELWTSYSIYCDMEQIKPVGKRTFYTKICNRKGLTKSQTTGGAKCVRGLRFKPKTTKNSPLTLVSNKSI